MSTTYRLVVLDGQQTVVGEATAETVMLRPEKTLIVRIADALPAADMDLLRQEMQRASPERHIVLVSNGIEFLRLEEYNPDHYHTPDRTMEGQAK